MNTALKIFFALGGVALVWKIVGNNARTAVHRGLGWVLHRFPVVKTFVLANKDRIEQILKDAEAGAEDAINEAEAK